MLPKADFNKTQILAENDQQQRQFRNNKSYLETKTLYQQLVTS